MYTLPMLKDIGSFLLPLNGLKPTRLTTASGVTYGTGIDRTAYKNIFLSAQVAVQASATLLATKQATFTWKLQHSDVDTSSLYTDLTDHAHSTAASVLRLGTTASTAAQTLVSGVSYANYRLSSAKKYVRVKVTPVIAAGSTVTSALGTVSALITFGSGQGKTIVTNL